MDMIPNAHDPSWTQLEMDKTLNRQLHLYN